MQHDQFLRHPLAQIAGGGDLLDHLQPAIGRRFADFRDVALAFVLAPAKFVERMALRLHMREVGAVQIRNRQFAEDIIQNRRRILHRVIALHHARRFKAGKGERIDIFLQRHAVLQADRDCDGEVVHHGAKACAFLVHVDENLT